MFVLDVPGNESNTFKAHSVRDALIPVSASITSNQTMNATNWSLKSVFHRFCYRPPRQVGVVVFSIESTDSLQTSC